MHKSITSIGPHPCKSTNKLMNSVINKIHNNYFIIYKIDTLKRFIFHACSPFGANDCECCSCALLSFSKRQNFSLSKKKNYSYFFLIFTSTLFVRCTRNFFFYLRFLNSLLNVFKEMLSKLSKSEKIATNWKFFVLFWDWK